MTMSRRKHNLRSKDVVALLGAAGLALVIAVVRSGSLDTRAIRVLVFALVTSVGLLAVVRVARALCDRQTNDRDLPRASELSTLTFPPESRHLR